MCFKILKLNNNYLHIRRKKEMFCEKNKFVENYDKFSQWGKKLLSEDWKIQARTKKYDYRLRGREISRRGEGRRERGGNYLFSFLKM